MDEVNQLKDPDPSRKRTSGIPNLTLRRERELRGWSQAMVAEKIGAQTPLVNRWENGNAFPSPYYREKLCQLFEKDAASLGLIKERATRPASDHPTAQETPLSEGDTPVVSPPPSSSNQHHKILSRRARPGCSRSLSHHGTRRDLLVESSTRFSQSSIPTTCSGHEH